MIEVTESATTQIAEYFKDKDKEVSPVRIFLNTGCGGPSLAMALDESKDTDSVYDVGGFKYVVDKDLMEKAGFVKVDFLNIGFKITSGIDLGIEPKSCGSKNPCCS